MNRQEKAFEFNFIDILQFMYRWRWQWGIACIIAVVVSAIVSGPMFIKPKYRAEAIFYPTTVNSIGNAMFTDLNKREGDLLAFGEEEEAENALQILQSSTLQDRIIRNFDLINHYKIDAKGRSPYTELAKRMSENMEFKRTRYLSVKITVLDEDPSMAAKIANGITEIYDTVKTEIQQQVALEAFKIIEDQYKQKEKEVWDYRTNLKELANMGITNYEEQSRAVSEEIFKLKAAGRAGSQLVELESQQSKLAKYGPDFTYYNETLILELENLSLSRKRYEKAKVDVEKTLTHKFMLTRATAPEKKATPIRWLIVLASAAATFVFMLVLLLFVENRKRITDSSDVLSAEA